MIVLVSDPLAKKIGFDADNLLVELVDGRKISVPLAWFPRLLAATPGQRARFEMSGGGSGLHWDELDEDISVKNLLLGIGDRTMPLPPDRVSPAA